MTRLYVRQGTQCYHMLHNKLEEVKLQRYQGDSLLTQLNGNN